MQGAKRKSTHGWMLLLGVGDGIALQILYKLQLLAVSDVDDARVLLL